LALNLNLALNLATSLISVAKILSFFSGLLKRSHKIEVFSQKFLSLQFSG